MVQSGTKIAAVRETRKGALVHKTNERPGTRAQARYIRVSAYKAREVLDLIRGRHVADAEEILQFVDRDVADVVRKVVASAVANATTNDSQDPEALFISACYADEGPTLKRWRPRARGRATRIRKRTCHITVIVSRLGEAELRRRTDRQARSTGPAGGAASRASRRARVARSRQAPEVAETTAEAPELDASVPAMDEEVDAVEAHDAVEADGAAETTSTDGPIKGNADSMKYHVPGSQWYDQTDAEVTFDTVQEAEAAGYEAAGSVGQQQPEGAEIKGNADSMKYHVPGSQWYDQTEPEVWFQTVEDAEAAGYEPAGGDDKQDVEVDKKDED
jgi:large subunit ribosomal protein L22